MNIVTLPPRKNHKTPRLLVVDAYTIGSNVFESDEAKEKSVYYITFRKRPFDFNPDLYEKDDQRYIFYGLQKILDYLFYEPITHAEIDETKRFLADKKITTKGLTQFFFPEDIWRKVVDEYNGRPPILITALREGSVFYPNEPIIQIESQVVGMGILAAWFESKLLQVWAASEFVTQNEHWLKYCKEMVLRVYKTGTGEQIDFLARMMVHNFGDRAGMNWLESEILGEAALLTFSGTDTFAGAYQAWKNSNEASGIAMSVNALAHRNVQSYETEEECYRAIYNASNDGEIISMVADCYSFYDAVEKYLVPLAKLSATENTNKIVVARPDSGNALEQVTWLCRTAVKHGLYEEKVIDGVTWRFPTTLKCIEGDGMTWPMMKKINNALLEQGFPPFAWCPYGIGGGLRNGLKRDDVSAKYALCSIGLNEQAVVKFSEDLGKTTLPGPFKVRRDSKSLVYDKQTIAFASEDGEDALIEYFNGLRKEKPFGIGQDDNFKDVKNNIRQQMNMMPLNLETEGNHNYPATLLIREKRKELLHRYAPKKLSKNY